MLTYEDCLELTELDEATVRAVVEHDHLHPFQAVAELNHLLHKGVGRHCLRKIIVEDIRRAQCCGNRKHERELRQLLSQIYERYPQRRYALRP